MNIKHKRRNINKIIVLILCSLLPIVAGNNYLSGKCHTPLDNGDIYTEWMLYLDDNALLSDIILPESHNAGAIHCTICGLRCKWLDCQKDDIYTQLCYGIRNLDIRIMKPLGGVLHIAHGVAKAKMTLEQALADIRRFRENYPSEIISLTIRGYSSNSVKNGAQAEALIAKYLEPEKYAISKDVNLSEVKMKKLRESKKNYIIRSYWVADQYNNNSLGTVGTWNGNVNFGKVIDGQKLYDHLYALLDEHTERRLTLSLNRASGDKNLILNKENPIDYMLHDRENFIMLTDYLTRNTDKLAKVAGFAFDVSTYDYVQTGRVLLLNAVKGLIKKEYENDFYDRITEKIRN
jgi:hypothetical protein